MEQVATVNDIFKYRTPYEVALAGKYPGAEFALFDVHQLVSLVFHTFESRSESGVFTSTPKLNALPR